ncbi:MAG: ATP-binding cassette domain-containing protein [Pirellulales bacterium]
MPPPVVLEQLSKRFGQHTAVDRLDLTVPAGAIYGFIGPNGSGKTTTLRLILRIFQPDGGVVRVLGSDQGSVADDRIGYLSEERGLYKRMKVREVLTFFARLKGLRNCRPEIERWLERLDAQSWADKKIEALSKGMAQKIQFIAAVVARPELVILDEPFSGLDPVNLDLLRGAVRELRDRGSTVIFSTHDMHVAEELCDTVFMICQGRKVLDGPLPEIRRAYASHSVRLRLADGAPLPGQIPGVERSSPGPDGWALQLVKDHPPQAVLRWIVDQAPVEHFEVVQPTLHDIFVTIAGGPAGAREGSHA